MFPLESRPETSFLVTIKGFPMTVMGVQLVRSSNHAFSLVCFEVFRDVVEVFQDRSALGVARVYCRVSLSIMA